MTSIKPPELRALFSSLLLILALSMPAAAQQESSTEELAKKTQNPVADLISVPFQNNFNFNTGSKDATVYILNVQPVIPIHLTHDWNLITRTIMPIINQPSLFPGPNSISGSAWGLGDINPSLFLSPAKPGAVIWGAGPTFTIPTATDSKLGSGKFSLGPTAVALVWTKASRRASLPATKYAAATARSQSSSLTRPIRVPGSPSPW